MNEPVLAPRRELSLLQTASLVVGTVIGSGVFLSLPIVARIGQNPLLTVLIWFLGGVVWIPQILILAEMGTAYPIQGGAYYYLQKAGSPFLAFFYTWTAFLTSDTPTLTIVGLGAIAALKFFSPVFADPLISRVLAAVLIIGLALLHYRSVRTGGNVQILLTVAKLLPLLGIVIIGMFYMRSGNLTGGTVPATTLGLATVITAGISSTLWSYAGFTNILYMAGEVKRPERTLPIALIGSLAFIMVAYTLIALCTSAIVPFEPVPVPRDRCRRSGWDLRDRGLYLHDRRAQRQRHGTAAAGICDRPRRALLLGLRPPAPEISHARLFHSDPGRAGGGAVRAR